MYCMHYVEHVHKVSICCDQFCSDKCITEKNEEREGLTDWIEFYAVSAIYQPCFGGRDGKTVEFFKLYTYL